jgi:hypothetical protein
MITKAKELNMKRTLLIPLTVLLLASAVQARTLVVDPAHSQAADSNPGTQDKPFKTISAGTVVLRAGDTLLIHPGVYRETVRLKESGTAESPIVIQAATKGTVTIRGSALVSDWRRSEANPQMFIHDGWDKYFGKWDDTLAKGGDQFRAKFGGPGTQTMAFGQVFVNGTLIREVACPEKREAGTFYIDKDKKQIHLWLANGADPNQCRVEVTERNVLLEALNVSDLQVKRLDFEHCANGMQQAAVNFRGGTNNLIEDCAISHTAMVGLRMAADHHVVRRCVMNHNGQQGFCSPGSESVLIEDSETSYNNLIPWKRVNVGFQAGGFKVAVAHKLKFLRHKAIGNFGPGLWFDISNDEMEVANCFATDNQAFGGVMNEISYRIHVHDSVFINNKGGGVLIAESPGALVERNIMIGNDDGVHFRDMLRSTAKVSIVDGRSVKGEKTAIWNHDEVVRQNVFFNNTRAQVNFGIKGINANRQIPERLQARNVDGKRTPPDQATRDAAAYQDRSGVPQPAGLSLEKLSFSINGNVYWGGEAVPLMRWGSVLSYGTLKDLRAGEGFEKDGAVLDPQFADWRKLDLRVPADSPLIKMGCYPRGEVPGVKLGVIRE